MNLRGVGATPRRLGWCDISMDDEESGFQDYFFRKKLKESNFMNASVKKLASIGVCGLFAFLVFLFTPLFSVSGSGQSGEFLTYAKLNLFGMKHGRYVEKLKSGQVVLEGSFFLGKHAKVWKWFDANQVVTARCNYGQSPALCEAYFESGELKEKVFSEPKVDFSKIFFDSQRSQWESAYCAGKRVGEYRQFYRSGKIKVEGTYQDGSAFGIWKFFRTDGKVRMTKQYSGELNELEIKTQTFNLNGKLASENLSGTSLAVRNRVDQVFYESGQSFFRMKLRGGAPEEISFLEPSGASIVYCDVDEFGLYCGLESERGTGSTAKVQAYYPSGAVALDIETQGGRLNGRLTRFFENGSVANFYTFDHGALDGEAAFYDEDGRLEAVKVFKRWKLVGAQYYDADGDIMEYPDN